jgi:hypothetical protein
MNPTYPALSELSGFDLHVFTYSVGVDAYSGGLNRLVMHVARREMNTNLRYRWHINCFGGNKSIHKKPFRLEHRNGIDGSGNAG